MNIVDGLMPWSSDWLWSLPLSAITVVVHVFGLNLIRGRFHSFIESTTYRTLSVISLSVMAGITLCVTVLHGLEAYIWAMAFRWLGALPNQKTAVLFSLNAMTTFGHSGYNLEGQWHLMGALEALNGWILFGLSTAFLYGVNQRIWKIVPELHEKVIIEREREEVNSTF
jgi:hypothetical protein